MDFFNEILMGILRYNQVLVLFLDLSLSFLMVDLMGICGGFDGC